MPDPYAEFQKPASDPYAEFGGTSSNVDAKAPENPGQKNRKRNDSMMAAPRTEPKGWGEKFAEGATEGTLNLKKREDGGYEQGGGLLEAAMHPLDTISGLWEGGKKILSGDPNALGNAVSNLPYAGVGGPTMAAAAPRVASAAKTAATATKGAVKAGAPGVLKGASKIAAGAAMDAAGVPGNVGVIMGTREGIGDIAGGIADAYKGGKQAVKNARAIPQATPEVMPPPAKAIPAPAPQSEFLPNVPGPQSQVLPTIKPQQSPIMPTVEAPMAPPMPPKAAAASASASMPPPGETLYPMAEGATGKPAQSLPKEHYIKGAQTIKAKALARMLTIEKIPLADALTMTPEQWEMAAQAAGVNKPSAATIAQAIEEMKKAK